MTGRLSPPPHDRRAAPPRARRMPSGLLLAMLLATGAASGPAAASFLHVESAPELDAGVQSDPAGTWAALQPLRERFEGDPDFDLLLGRAALATGRRLEAELALERVEFIAPETPGVRALLISLRTGAVADGEPVSAASPATPPPDAQQRNIDRSALRPLEARLEAGDWAAALALALALRDEWEGDTTFDQLFGVATLEAGRPEEAVFALQRVLFLDPTRLRARVHLARAHFVSGNLDQAETEFRRVLAGGDGPERRAELSPEVRAGVTAYLTRIEALRDQRSPRLIASVEFGGGHDDNVSSATRDSSVVTPLGSFELGDAGRQQGSGFNRVRAAVTWEQPLSRRRTLDLVLAAALRHNFSAHEFDLDVYRFETGYAITAGAHRVRAAAGATLITLDDAGFQRSASIGAQWSFAPASWRLGAGLDLATVRYADDETRDVEQLLVTLGAEYARPGDLLMLELFGATEQARDDDFDHNGRDLVGASALWRHVAGVGHVPFLRLRATRSRHHDTHPVFAVLRRDVTRSATLGWNWFLSEEVSARAEVSYSDAESNLDLFDHDRTQLETALRYRF